MHQSDYSYARLVDWTRELVFDHLDLNEVTLVGQDWGGLIGLRLVAEHPDRFSRVVAANTGLSTGDFDMPEGWWQFRRAVEKTEVLDIGRLIAAGCVRPIADDVRAAQPPSKGHGSRQMIPHRSLSDGDAVTHTSRRPRRQCPWVTISFAATAPAVSRTPNHDWSPWPYR